MKKMLCVAGVALTLLIGQKGMALSKAHEGASEVETLSSARELIGNPQGKLLGIIDDITAGPDHQGKAAFAILTYEVFP